MNIPRTNLYKQNEKPAMTLKFLCDRKPRSKNTYRFHHTLEIPVRIHKKDHAFLLLETVFTEIQKETREHKQLSKINTFFSLSEFTRICKTKYLWQNYIKNGFRDAFNESSK